MSNKIVPVIYRAVIDDVISAIKPEFDEYGVAEDVLAELQHKWESKVIASHVADFDTPHPPPVQHHVYPPHPIHMMQQHHYPPPHNPYAPAPHQAQPQAQPHVKAEPLDPRYVLNGPPGMAYALPPLPGPQLNGPRLPHPGQQAVLTYPPGQHPPGRPPQISHFPRIHVPQAPPGPQLQVQQQQPQQPPPPPQPQRIPQVDGPSSSSSESSSPPPSQSFTPHSSHPSIPQPPRASTSTQPDDSEAINSDLDDSDTEGEEDAEDGGAGETDIVFCTYDKVARVKNKWKCILKDGMIHVNGRDYLFAKCTGEFEW